MRCLLHPRREVDFRCIQRLARLLRNGSFRNQPVSIGDMTGAVKACHLSRFKPAASESSDSRSAKAVLRSAMQGGRTDNGVERGALAGSVGGIEGSRPCLAELKSGSLRMVPDRIGVRIN